MRRTDGRMYSDERGLVSISASGYKAENKMLHTEEDPLRVLSHVRSVIATKSRDDTHDRSAAPSSVLLTVPGTPLFSD